MKIYISFGQDHAHAVNGKTFDKDCLAEIECESHEAGREVAFEAFGPKFSTSYPEEKVPSILHFFPRGIIPLNRSIQS